VLLWVVVGLALGAWSLLCWMGQAVLGWAGWAQGLDWATASVRLELPSQLTDWLGLGWVNALNDQLVAWGPALHNAVSGLPDLSGWIGVLIWILWGLGALGLVLAGGLTSGLIALAQRGARPS
jgi:hypothetical protein